MVTTVSRAPGAGVVVVTAVDRSPDNVVVVGSLAAVGRSPEVWVRHALTARGKHHGRGAHLEDEATRGKGDGCVDVAGITLRVTDLRIDHGHVSPGCLENI